MGRHQSVWLTIDMNIKHLKRFKRSVIYHTLSLNVSHLTHCICFIVAVTLCYGHKSSTGTVRRLFHQKSYDYTEPVRRPAGGRKNRTIFYQFLDIVWCPVKFRYYLKFHGARTAFGRVNEGKMTSAGHRTVPGRRPTGVCTHRTGTGRFLFKI